MALRGSVWLASCLSISLSIASSLCNTDTSVTLLYQNNLNGTDDINHVGFLLLDEFKEMDASAACKTFNEGLLTKATINAHSTDVISSLAYVVYAGRADPFQLYFIHDGVLGFSAATQSLSFPGIIYDELELPVLCTQSSNQSQPRNAKATTTNELHVASGGNTYVGFRNQKSFRFLGIPYADPPQRFIYSNLYSGTGQTLNATAYGSQCAQSPFGSENCLFLNIQTPYIPKQGDTSDLRPVMFWIHGGGFTAGSGADSLSDGGNLASREDIVVVTINYRLSTLGFLAIPGTNITGNYGIADQITALEWTVKNIASFGGDPNQITITGESAGAGSVRVLLGSPPAIGMFQGAIAMSNLGGGVDLGLNGDYATTYSSYDTVAQSYAAAGQNIFEAAGCNQSVLNDQITCLEAVPALKLVDLPAVARYVVQDGHFVNTEELNVAKRNPGTAYVPVIFGIADNDGASFSTYPTKPVTTQLDGITASLGISTSFAQNIINSGLFPYYDSGNVTLDSFNVSQRIATDIQFRCVDQATVYASSQSSAFTSSYFYQMNRTIGGFDPNNLGGAPVVPGFPLGNPELPYFKLHGADMPWMFGTLSTLRDPQDLWSEQVTTGYFAEFIKSGQPNPPLGYLQVRGYTKTIENVQQTGPWNEVSGMGGPIRVMNWPAVAAGFVDVPQCAFLNYSLSYYLDGGL